MEIDFINQFLSAEQEFNLGSGYVKITDGYLNIHTDDCSVVGEILDAHRNTIGNLDVNGHFYHDIHKVSVGCTVELNLKGDIEKILSL